MVNGRLRPEKVSRFAMWFSLLGGAIAWTAHLLLIYSISEWGCVQWPASFAFLGITATAWLLLVVSAVMMLTSAAAAWVGLRYARKAEQEKPEMEDADFPRHAEYFISHTGLIMSGTFAFIILVETIPTFYFLQSC